jgi:hypothetical protein
MTRQSHTPAYTIHTETKPQEGQIIIAWDQSGKRDMVQIHSGQAMLWRYGLTDELFCSVDEIAEWRGCGGMDF